MVVHTGDVRGAGTDANVILTLYGEKGKSDEFKLRNKTDNFERAKVDKFKVGCFHLVILSTKRFDNCRIVRLSIYVSVTKATVRAVRDN